MAGQPTPWAGLMETHGFPSNTAIQNPSFRGLYVVRGGGWGRLTSHDEKEPRRLNGRNDPEGW